VWADRQLDLSLPAGVGRQADGFELACGCGQTGRWTQACLQVWADRQMDSSLPAGVGRQTDEFELACGCGQTGRWT